MTVRNSSPSASPRVTSHYKIWSVTLCPSRTTLTTRDLMQQGESFFAFRVVSGLGSRRITSTVTGICTANKRVQKDNEHPMKALTNV